MAAERGGRVPSGGEFIQRKQFTLPGDGGLGQNKGTGHLLKALGRPGDFANDESPVIRKWRVMAKPEGGGIPGPDAAWTTAYSKVSGELPPDDLSVADHVLAGGAIDVQVAGDARLKLNRSEGLRLWIDNQEVPGLSGPIDLAKGRHVLIFAIDRTARGSETGLRVEINTPPGSPLKFQIEGGM